MIASDQKNLRNIIQVRWIIMNEILDYFENMDEAVYISDMETNELVYMNKSLRNYFDYQSHEEYSGKIL